MIVDDEKRATHHRWRLPGESGAGRMGGDSAPQPPHARAAWLGAADYQQSHGIDGGDRRLARVEIGMRSRSDYRFRIREEWNHPVESWMEKERQEDGREEARGESGFVGRAGRIGVVAQNHMELDERPRRSRGQ